MRKAKLSFWIEGKDFLFLHVKVSTDDYYMRKFMVAQLAKQGWRTSIIGIDGVEMYKDLGFPGEVDKEDIEAKLPEIDTEELKKKIEEVEKIKDYKKEIEIVID